MYLFLCTVQWGSYARQEKGKQTRVFPTRMLLRSLWVHPSHIEVCLHGQIQPALLQTAAIHRHCSCSHPQSIALPNIPGLCMEPALPHKTSSHTPKPRTGKHAGNSLHSVDSSKSTSVCRQTLLDLLSQRKAATGKFPISLIAQILEKIEKYAYSHL